MEKYMRLSKAAAVIVALALVVAIAVTLAVAAPSTSLFVPSEESADALSQAAPTEDGTVSDYSPSGTPVSSMSSVTGSGSYYLSTNVEVSSPSSAEFSGTLDGNGKTITINIGGSYSDGTYGGLFGILKGTLKNVTIVVETFNYYTANAGDRTIGVIVGEMNGGTIENVKLQLNYVPTANNQSADVGYYFADNGTHKGGVFNQKNNTLTFGGVAGLVTSGTIKNVTVENNAGTDRGFSVYTRTSGNYASTTISFGLFCGKVSSATIENCTLRGNGNVTIGNDGNHNSYSGGAFGWLYKGTVTIRRFDCETAFKHYTEGQSNKSEGGFIIRAGNTGSAGLFSGIIDTGANIKYNVYNLFWNKNADKTRFDGSDDTANPSYMTYDPSTVAVSFDRNNGNVVLSAKAQAVNSTSLINQINFRGTLYSAWDKLIASSSNPAGKWTQVATFSLDDGANAGEITTTTVTRGTFSLSGGETIGGYSGGVYTVSRQYNGQAPQSPSVVLSNGGGTYNNVWSASGASANVGIYDMTFNQSALMDVVVADGDDGKTYIAKSGVVYAPGQINGSDIVLKSSIRVNIMQAQITSVTATVDYDVLFPESQKPTLQLVSVTPNVSGTLAWDDEPLEVGKTTYGWTFTPDNANYSTYHGTTELVVSDVVIERIEVTTDPNKTVYTAYDAFDPAGMVVTAYYSAQGVTSVLGNDEYTLKITNGDISRLLVANNTVTVKYNADPSFTDTIAITVEPRRIAVPTATTDLVYNGQQQTGVTAEGTYYTVSGNTATDAGDYTATASLNDVINTVWDNASFDTTAKQISWSIAPYAVTIGTPSVTSKTYDGEAVDPAGLFTAPNGVNGEGALALAITVDGGKTLLDADTYTIVAALAENVANENYTATQAQITYKIDKVVLDGTLAFGSAVYDGAAKDATFELTEGNTVGPDKIVVTYGGESDRTNVTGRAVTATAALPSANYEWAGAAPSASVTIQAMRVEIGAVDTLTKDYDGTETDAAELFVAPVGADDAELALTIVVEDGKTILNAGSYKVTASLDAGANYVADDKAIVFTIAKKIVVAPTVDEEQTFTYNGDVQTFVVAASADGSYTVEGNTATNAGNYTVTVSLVDTLNTEWNDSTGSAPKTYGWSIAQAVPVVDAQLSAPADLTTADTLDNAWLSRGSNSDGVPGSLAWTNAGALLAEGENEYEWTFSPTDTLNYEIVSGTFTVTAKLDTIVSIAVKDGTYKAVYTAFENFDPTGMIIVAHYESGKETEVTAGYTLAGNESLRYGQDGRAEVTVTLNGVSDTAVVTVERIVVAVPTAVTGLVYSGQQQTGVVDGDGYTMSGNTAATAGPHEATATLDSTDYVWTDGSVDPKNVTWTIAKVQITVASTDIGVKQIEYGSGYRWNASEFFTATAVNSDAFVVGVVAADGAVDLTAANIGNYTAGIKVVVYAQDSLVDDETLALNFDVQDVSALKMEVKIIAAKVTVTFAADDQPTEYDGEKVSFAAIRDNFTLSTGVEVDILVDGVAYDDADITNADDYEITIVSLDDNYELVGDTTVTFTIEKGEPYIAATLNIVGTVYSSETLNTVKMKLSSGYEDSTPGTFSWAPDQDLIVGDYEYEWIFTPDDTANYKIATGKFVITVVQATLTSISVSAPTRTEYFAYDAFDKSSITVTASYEDGSTKQVHNYSVILSSGTADALVAGENISVSVVYRDGDIEQSVNDAFVINVARLALTVPTLSGGPFVYDGEEKTVSVEQSDRYSVSGTLTATEVGEYSVVLTLTDPVNTEWADGTIEDKTLIWNINEPVTVNEVIEAINAMDEVVWSNALEFKALAEEYALLDASEIPAETAAKFATLQAQYDALCEAATSDIENAQKVTAKAAGRAVAAAGLAAAAIVAAILKRRFI